MKTFQLVSLLVFLGFSLNRVGAAEEIVVERIPLTPDQIEELVAPIALYPDPLVALILPAATFPSDIVLAARFLERGGSPENVGAEPWDDSVHALARYREVIDYLDDNLDWTRRLGYCFLDQRDAVMDAIQTVRIRARSAGLLADTPQQQVIVETEEIRIIPAEPTVIYIPRYDPVVLCRPSYPYSFYRGSFISFGSGWRIGTWLNFDCDWRSHGIRIVHRPAEWYHRPDWHDRNRYTRYDNSSWTRRTHSRNDDRFDRSPRYVSYNARGADHRNATSPNRYDNNRSRDGNRWDDDNRRDRDDYRGDDRRSTFPTHGQMAREIQDRQRRDMSRMQEQLTAPAVAAPTPAVQAPVQYRRPESAERSYHDRSSNERSNRADNSRRDRDQSADRSRQERVATPEGAQRSQPTTQTPPPERRVEASNRSEDRSRGDSRDRPNPNRGGRGRDAER